MKHYLNQLKYVLSKIELREIGVIIFVAFFVNHLTQAEQFPLDPAYQFPLLPIGFTIIVGFLLILIAKLNFQRYKELHFSKKITLRTILLFFWTTQGIFALFYLPAYLLANYISEEAFAIYDFLISIFFTLLLCSIYLFIWFSKPIFDLHKWVVLEGRLTIKRGEKTTLLNYTDIAYFYSKEKMVYLVKTDGVKLSTEFTLGQLETILADHIFFRVNRKVIIHFQAVTKVTAIENGKLVVQLAPDFSMIDATPIIISRYKKKVFQDWWQKKL